MHEEDFKTILLLIQLEIWNPESSGLPFFSRCHMGHGLGYPGYPKNFETNQDGSQWTWTVFHGTRSDWLGFSNDFLSNGLRP